MTDLQKMKRSFRSSKKWKEFRHQKWVEQCGKCYITHKKMSKSANLHHMDLNPDHYQDLEKSENFCFLQKSMHDVVHALYRYYKNDETVLDRLKAVLDCMKEINK